MVNKMISIFKPKKSKILILVASISVLLMLDLKKDKDLLLIIFNKIINVCWFIQKHQHLQLL